MATIKRGKETFKGTTSQSARQAIQKKAMRFLQSLAAM